MPRLRPALLLLPPLAGMLFLLATPAQARCLSCSHAQAPVYVEPRFGVPALSQPNARSCPSTAQTFMVPGRQQQQEPVYEGSRLREDARVMAAPASEPRAVAKSAPARRPMMEAPAPAMDSIQGQGDAEPVKAGYVDDNFDFGEYLAYLKRNAQLQGFRPRDVAERYRVQVRDSAGRPLANALISASLGQSTVAWARSDQKGQAWFAPNAVFNPRFAEEDITLTATLDGSTGSAVLERGQKQGVDIRVDAQGSNAQGLDLVFLVDATGSMGDEIAKLRSSLHTIAGRISKLPGRPDLCIGLVAYRDQVDDFLIRGLQLTSNPKHIQKALDELQAEGGGDRPEALNESLAYTVNRLQWRGGNTVREVVLVADAEPHMDYGAPYYDQSAAAALAKGIRLHAVGASGLSKEGEYVFRQMAQYTGGKFVFLTYQDPERPELGAGDKTVHDVKNYSVDTLDDVIVRLVQEDLKH